MLAHINTNFIDSEPGLMIANTLSKVKKNKPFVVSIFNTTNRHYTLKKGTVVASTSKVELSDIQHINVTDINKDISEDKIQENHMTMKDDTQVHATETKVLNFDTDMNESPENIQQLKDLIERNKDLFANTDADIGLSPLKHNVKLSINTGDHAPIAQKPYKASLQTKQIIDTTVDSMLKANICYPSESPSASPVVIVRKKDGEPRFCVDYRKLNKITSKWVFPLPTLSDCLEILSNSKYFCKLDLKSGYWQIGINEADKDKTAFVCHKGIFNFHRLPFGLQNAPSVFNFCLRNVLKDLPFTFPYMDDILVASTSFSQHLQNIQKVFDRLRAAGLKLKASKCEFLKSEVQYLGHIISERRVC